MSASIIANQKFFGLLELDASGLVLYYRLEKDGRADASAADITGRNFFGEVAKLLCEAVNDESPDTECRIVLDEITALRSEIEGLQDGQVIVVFYDELEPVTKLLGDVGAISVSTIDEPKMVGAVRGADTYASLPV